MSPDALAKSIIELQRELKSSGSGSTSQNATKLVRGSTNTMLLAEQDGMIKSATSKGRPRMKKI